MNKIQMVGLFAVAALSACSTTEQHKISRIEAPMPVSAPPPPPQIAYPVIAPNSLLARRSVHFQNDTSAVQEADRTLLQAHARYLAEHPELRIRIEGNCDERGSNEYNLALGQRRADMVKKILLLGGARELQIQTISMGEEMPLATGHDEMAWQQNRRAELKY